MRVRSILTAAALACCFGASALAANPMYDSWAKCKPGTSVTMTGTTDMGTMKTESEQVYTLKEVTPEKVVVEMKMSTSMMGNKTDMPPQTMTIPATAAATPTTPTTPVAAGDAKITEEKVTVAGKEYTATCTTVKSDANGMKTTTSSWTSAEVPGTMLKMESKSDGQMSVTTKMEVTKIDVK